MFQATNQMIININQLLSRYRCVENRIYYDIFNSNGNFGGVIRIIHWGGTIFSVKPILCKVRSFPTLDMNFIDTEKMDEHLTISCNVFLAVLPYSLWG